MHHLSFDNVQLDLLITHHVGNKSNEDGILLSDTPSEIQEDSLEYLLSYFLSSFKPVEFYNFSHITNLELNEVYASVKNLFDSKEGFIEESQNMAKLLYEYSTHPNIKAGELNVVYFDQIIFNDELVDGIGIFKSESNVPFLQMNPSDGKYVINHDFGFELKGIDKACLVLNTDPSFGYSVLMLDNTNKSLEAQYWLNDFLKLKSSDDDYNKTKDFLDLTKQFISKEMPEELELSKTEKIDLLNKTVDYFKENETFEKDHFEQSVLKDEAVIESFQQFEELFQAENNIETKQEFTISNQAVKKQARRFRSVLKLDKNFHVYIHGDKNLIQKGVESDGRKFYKIYYERED